MVSNNMQNDSPPDAPQGETEAQGYEAFRKSLRPTPTDDPETKKETRRYWKHPKSKVEIATLFWVALYTIVTGFIYRAQLGANSVSQMNLVFGNKAAVSLSEASWYSTPNGVEFIPKWENTGNVATKNAQSHINFHVEGQPVTPGFSRLDYQPGLSLLSIGAKAHSSMTYFTLPKACFEDLVAKRAADLRVWGWITYYDGFTDIRHTTRFCWLVNSLMVNFQQIKSVAPASYYLCDEGNCSDAECDNQPMPAEPLPAAVPCIGNAQVSAAPPHNLKPAP